MFDLVAEITKSITLLVMIVAVVLIILFRHRVLFVLTGDDRIHADIHTTVWSLLTCCRLCTGEWTRYVSACLCFWHKGLRGRNLKRCLGQAVGIVPVPVRFTNIVVGDLPTAMTGDFYVAIEVGEAPVQITSVVEDANPKVVQFEETLIVRIRHSPAEFQIRITVRRLNAFGNQELCECYINPISVAFWQYRRKGPMRFRMEPLDRSCDLSFPPWILVEIVPQPEFGTPEAFMAPQSFDVRLTEMSTGTSHQLWDASSFKRQYALLTTRGFKADEPDEDKVGALDCVKRARVGCWWYWAAVYTAVSMSFWGVRYYSSACVYEFEKLATLANWVEDFPCTNQQRDHYLRKCGKNEMAISILLRGFLVDVFEDSQSASQNAAQQLDHRMGNTTFNGTAVTQGLKHFIPGFQGPGMSNEVYEKCNPDLESTMKVCKRIPFGAVHPFLVVDLGILRAPIACTEWACDVEKPMQHWDFPYFMFSIIWLLGSCAMHYGFGRWIRTHEERLHHAHEHHAH